MKKFCITLLCATTVMLSACDQNNKTDQNQSVATHELSTNNIADIKQDLELLKKHSDEQAEKSIEFQDRFSNTLASQPSAQLAMEEVTIFFNDSNKHLDALKIKSSEANQERQILKEINLLTIQLTQTAVSNQADPQKIEEIQIKLQNLQLQLNENRTNLEKKLSETKS